MQPRYIMLLALLGVLVLVLLRGETQDDKPSTIQSDATLSAYATGITIKNFDGSGPAQFKIESTETKFYKNNQEVELLEPRIWFHSDTNQDYQLRAQKGLYNIEEAQFELQDQVELSGQNTLKATETGEPNTATIQAANIQLQTEHLTFNTDSRFISTERMVKISYGPHTLVAKGMTIDIDQHNMKLLANVKGQYFVD